MPEVNPQQAYNVPFAAQVGFRGGDPAAAGRKGAESRARNQEEVAREKLERHLSKLTGELIKAAEGKPPFEDLAPKERLSAVIKALEFGMGRPAAGKRAAPEAPAAPTPDDLFA
jgi:hypothetical protein